MVYPILAVKDVDASIAFYIEKLGFEKDMALPNAEGKTAFAFVSLGKEPVGFGLDETLKVERGAGVVLMISVAEGTDVDEVYKSVQSKGIAIEQEIKTEYWGDRTFAVKDPDGYYICLYQTIHQPDMEHVAKVFSGEVQPE